MNLNKMSVTMHSLFLVVGCILGIENTQASEKNVESEDSFTQLIYPYNHEMSIHYYNALHNLDEAYKLCQTIQNSDVLESICENLALADKSIKKGYFSKDFRITFEKVESLYLTCDDLLSGSCYNELRTQVLKFIQMTLTEVEAAENAKI